MASVIDSYAKEIKDSSAILKQIRRDREAFSKEKEVLELEKMRYNIIYSQVHTYLAPKKTEKAESEIQDIIRDVILLDLGVAEAKVKRFSDALELISKKKKVQDNVIELYYKYLQEWLTLFENFWALASFRSLEHFAQFMEWETPDRQKVWKYSLDPYNDGGKTGVNKPFFHFFNRMVLKKDIKFISKQMFTGGGKCMLATTKVYTPDGLKTLADLKVGDYIYSMKDRELVVKQVLNKWETRKKQVKIVTRGCKELIVSPEHKLYTTNGYVKAENLTLDDYLYRVCSKISPKKEYKISDEKLGFITCMIFDGHCKNLKYGFTKNQNSLIYKYFQDCCKKLGLKTSNYVKTKNTSTCRVLSSSNNNYANKLMVEYGLEGKLSKEKELPNQFFNLSLENKYKFLGIMFATDGYMGRQNHSSDIGITLASEQLIDDIQVLLDQCGIYSVKNYKKSKCGGKEFDAWRLTIPAEYFEIIAQNCYCYDKEQLKNDLYYEYLNLETKPYCNVTNYPKELLNKCKEFKKIVRKQWSRNKTFKRYLVEDFNKKTHLLDDIVYKDFVWEQIKSIEYIDELADMVDIEVEETHNFVANGIVSHNSFSNQVAISWLFGINKDNDVLDVLGNPALVLTNTKSVVELMIKPRYSLVFPEYQKYHDMGGDIKGNMFSVCRIKYGELTIEGSTRPLNLKVISKQTSIDGIRVRYLFLDDVCRSKDANNLKMHQEDIDNFWNSWFKRNYGTDDFYIIVGGTAYSVEDILSHLIRYYSKGKMLRTAMNKYTFQNEDGDCVFIKIPKIDDDFNRSTYPQKFPYEEAVKARERNYNSFMAMEQQTPVSPETSPLAWEKLNTYSEIPSDLSEYSLACLDPARSGKNYVTMGIHRIRIEKDKYGTDIERHYLVDCIFELKKMEDVYSTIVEKIQRHNIVRLAVENNTDTSLPNMIEKLLHENGITSCEVIGFYSYENKQNKIDEIVYSNEAVFQNQMVYPCFSMYAPSHPMGKFMQYLTSYDYKEKMEYDDSIDEECMYIKNFVKGKAKTNKAVVLYV